MPKETLKELTNEIREINEEIATLSFLDLDTEEEEQLLASIQSKIIAKVESVDHVIMSFDIGLAKLDAEMEILERERDVRRNRQLSIEKNKKRIMRYLYDIGIVTDDKPLRTSAHTYFAKDTWGSVEIDDQTKLPSKYVKTKIEQVIDKSALRFDLMTGEKIPGASCSKTKQVVRR